MVGCPGTSGDVIDEMAVQFEPELSPLRILMQKLYL
jgi:hypothetical protein